MRALLLALLAAAAMRPALADEPASHDPTEPRAQPEAPHALEIRPLVRTAAPRFAAGEWLLNVHLSAGVEPHPQSASLRFLGAAFKCSSEGSTTCSVIAFGIGGEALWRGFVGFGLGLYASEGSPLVPGSSDQTALADRISVNASLAVRPLALWAWPRGDRFTTRLASGFGIELGPSVEYTRTSSATLPGCDIGAVATRPGLHGLTSLELPLLGDARTGWVSLRLAARVIVSSEVGLAPTQAQNEATCHAQVVQAGVATQFLAGLSYHL